VNVPQSLRFLEANPAPLAQVLFVDGDASEVPAQDFPDLRERVEPGEQFGAGYGSFEPLVDFLADFQGQTGDFAVAGFHDFHGVGGGFIISFFVMASFSQSWD